MKFGSTEYRAAVQQALKDARRDDLTPAEAKNLQNRVAVLRSIKQRHDTEQGTNGVEKRISDLDPIPDENPTPGEPRGSWRAEGFKIGGGRVGAKSLLAGYRKQGIKAVVTSDSANAQAARDGEDYIDPRKPRFITDLIPGKAVAAANEIEYRRQSARVLNADIVADGAQKPTSEFTLTVESGTLHTIAHMSEYVPNRYFEDDAGLQSFITMELLLGYNLRVEEAAVAAILADPDVLTQSFATDKFTTLRKAVTKLQAKYVTPTILAVSLEDAEALDLEQDNEGRFYFAGPTGAGPNGPIWSSTVVINDAMPEGTAIVADIAQAARHYTNGTYRLDVDPYTRFDYNETRARLEGRSLTVLTRPYAVCVVDLGTGS